LCEDIGKYVECAGFEEVEEEAWIIERLVGSKTGISTHCSEK